MWFYDDFHVVIESHEESHQAFDGELPKFPAKHLGDIRLFDTEEIGGLSLFNRLLKKSPSLILSFRGVPFAEESLFLFCKFKPQTDSSAKGTPRNDSDLYFFLRLLRPRCFMIVSILYTNCAFT